LIIFWKRHGKGIGVRARMAGTPELPQSAAQDFLNRVNDRARTKPTQKYHHRGELYYRGFPWRGELWLSDMLRLGPPSLEDKTDVMGQRVILVDAQVEAISELDALSAFNLLLEELSVFLSVVMRMEVAPRPRDIHREWTFDIVDGREKAEPRWRGYREPVQGPGMPSKGATSTVQLYPVNRPDFTSTVQWTMLGQALPADVAALWKAYIDLPNDGRRQFLQAANPYRVALSIWDNDRTLSLALMVVACEALKLPGQMYDGHNAPCVIGALLGEEHAQEFRTGKLPPLGVRNAHLHRGEFMGGEFLKRTFFPTDFDPTFDARRGALRVIAPAAIIEWLRKGGNYSLPTKRFRASNRWGWKSITAIVIGSAAIGNVAGWWLHAFFGRR
jgi:hypothetical protein